MQRGKQLLGQRDSASVMAYLEHVDRADHAALSERFENALLGVPGQEDPCRPVGRSNDHARLVLVLARRRPVRRRVHDVQLHSADLHRLARVSSHGFSVAEQGLRSVEALGARVGGGRDEDIPDGNDLQQAAENVDLSERILSAAKKLPPVQNLVFHLRDVQDFSIEEISEIAGISAGSVKTNLCYARKRLRIAMIHMQEGERR